RNSRIRKSEGALPLKTMLPTTTPETFTSVMDELVNVAVSDGPFGGPPAVQLAALAQLFSDGTCSQVALPSSLICALSSRIAADRITAKKNRGLIFAKTVQFLFSGSGVVFSAFIFFTDIAGPKFSKNLPSIEIWG